jgi:hypothetical protein
VKVGGFEDAYTTWRSQRFPPGSAHEALDELHADLVLADTWVAETVIPFVEHGVHHPARVNVIDELRKLRSRAVALGQAGELEDKRLADSYRDYAELLLRLYEGFIARGEPRA